MLSHRCQSTVQYPFAYPLSGLWHYLQTVRISLLVNGSIRIVLNCITLEKCLSNGDNHQSFDLTFLGERGPL